MFEVICGILVPPFTLVPARTKPQPLISVRISGMPLFTYSYEAILLRSRDGKLSPLMLSQAFEPQFTTRAI
ncbi:hypothetical protein K505DRAFT_324289 [Melanomma pulvis-pyrius CBS 109.77]|uniref:Uncharacterized protein n=1 Tax=Melanomma pulvis-pyrius CBS 109.77 TaxID=1314802 RepID=A0A6A6XFB6_9PLEO|nr:hypothetical protein K505DRAFT_324289 [Melanomma pulvis-pyrius CBS 109.77]